MANVLDKNTFVGPPQRTPMPKRIGGSKEVASLLVRGSLFTNWTSIRVEQRVTEAFPQFQFECSEESKIPLKVDALQFVPGDVVAAFVGGVQAVFGYITERHVAYDGKQHGVRLVGVGDTADLTTSMVPLEKLSGHDGQSWTELAKDISNHLGVKIIPKGAVDNSPFQNIQVQPGEKIMAVLERYAKMRNIVIGSEATGGLLAIGEHQAIATGNLTEGNNILRANCVVRDQMVYKKIYAVGQGTSGDQASGDQQNKQIAQLDGTSTRNRYMITVADIADTLHGVQRRAQMEKVFTEGSEIEAQIVVQGWFKDNNKSDEVWRAGEYYQVESPSLILHQILGCSGCIYEQSDAGTTTTLIMVDPIHMNGLRSYRDAVAKQAELQKAEQAGKDWLNERSKAYDP
jgi:prophage tail gpP-like protein